MMRDHQQIMCDVFDALFQPTAKRTASDLPQCYVAENAADALKECLENIQQGETR